MEGCWAGAGTAFTDVAGGAYYAQSVAWASANGIVNGFEDGSFRPGEAITREQMAAIFMRYARYRGVDVTAQASLDSFPDQAKVSSYAREAMAWVPAPASGVPSSRWRMVTIIPRVVVCWGENWFSAVPLIMPRA